MTWLEHANCAGHDQGDNLTPPGHRERWKPKDEAVVIAALKRCATCTVAAPCLAEAMETRRDGANGGIYSYHGGGGTRRWTLRAGKLHRLPVERND